MNEAPRLGAVTALLLVLAVACSKPGRRENSVDPKVPEGSIGTEAVKLARPFFKGRHLAALRALGPSDCTILADRIDDLSRLIPVAARSSVHFDKVLTQLTLDEVFRSVYMIQESEHQPCHDLIAQAWQRLSPADGLSWTPPLDRADAEARAREREACPSDLSSEDTRRDCHLSDSDRVKRREEVQDLIRDATKTGRPVMLSSKAIDLDAIEVYVQRIDDAKLIDLHADLFIDDTEADGGSP